MTKAFKIKIIAIRKLKIFCFVIFLLCVSSNSFAQYTAGDYGSFATGNWGNTNANWRVWNGIAWVGAPGAPGTANKVFILSGHTITVEASLKNCLDLTVETGATLYTAGFGGNRYINVYGNIFVNGTIGFGAIFDGISFNIEGPNCTITSPLGTGIFIASRMRKNFVVNPVTNLIIDMNINLSFNSGTQTQIYNAAVNTDFNVTVNAGKTLSIFTAAGFTGNVSMDGTNGAGGQIGGSYTINGTLAISGILYLTTNNTIRPVSFTIGSTGLVQTSDVVANASGTIQHTLTMNTGSRLMITKSGFVSTFSLVNNNYNLNIGSTIEYSASSGVLPFGDQNVDFNLPYANLRFSGSGNKYGMGTTNVSGNITMAAGTEVFVPGVNTFNIGGNWSNYGTAGFDETNSTINFNGSANQNLTCTGGDQFNNLSVTKPSGKVILGPFPVTIARIAGVLALNQGNILSNAGSYPLILATGSVGAVSNASFVEGPCGKTGFTNFMFPIGKVAEWRPLAIGAISASTTFIAQYFNVDPNTVPYDVTQKDATLDHISRCEFWRVRSSVPVVGMVGLSWDTYSCGVTNLAALSVASWDGATWKDHGNGATVGTTALGGITANVMSGFTTADTAFTLSSTQPGNNPLPITLISFTAKKETEKVKLEWVTAAEVNNDFFTIERSTDNNSFSKLIERDGAGNSTEVLYYSDYDKHPAEGINYYRLKQTDFDGKYSYSNTVAVDFKKGNDGVVSVYPNPVADKFYLNVSSSEDKNYIVKVFDVRGSEVMHSTLINFSKDNLHAVDVSVLSKGVYYLQLTSADDVQQVKLVKD